MNLILSAFYYPEKSLLEELGDRILAPSTSFLGGRKVTVAKIARKVSEKEASLIRKTYAKPIEKSWNTALAIALLIPSLLLGLSIKLACLLISHDCRANYAARFKQWQSGKDLPEENKKVQHVALICTFDPKSFPKDFLDHIRGRYPESAEVKVYNVGTSLLDKRADLYLFLANAPGGMGIGRGDDPYRSSNYHQEDWSNKKIIVYGSRVGSQTAMLRQLQRGFPYVEDMTTA